MDFERETAPNGNEPAHSDERRHTSSNQAPVRVDTAVGSIIEAPRGLREDFLAATFAATLRRPQVGVREDFFQLGGDSLKASVVLTAIRERLDEGMATRKFFDRPTVEGCAELIGGDAVGWDADSDEQATSVRAASHWQGCVSNSGAHDEQGSPRAMFECLASASGHELDAKLRLFAASKLLAPCVIYIAAWSRVLASFGHASPTLAVNMGTEWPRREAWLLSGDWQGQAGTLESDFGQMQRTLLHPGSAPEVASSPTAFLCYGCTAEQVRGVPPWLGAIESSLIGLQILPGERTRFELVGVNGARSPISPQQVLSAFEEQLEALIGARAGSVS